MNTTAGSFSLLGSVVPGDAGVVKKLRRAGAILLGAFLFIFAPFHKFIFEVHTRESKPFGIRPFQRQPSIWLVWTWWSSHKRLLPQC